MLSRALQILDYGRQNSEIIKPLQVYVLIAKKTTSFKREENMSVSESFISSLLNDGLKPEQYLYIWSKF